MLILRKAVWQNNLQQLMNPQSALCYHDFQFTACQEAGQRDCCTASCDSWVTLSWVSL